VVVAFVVALLVTSVASAGSGGWRKARPPEGGWINVVAVAPGGGPLLAGTNEGVFVSRDRQSWQEAAGVPRASNVLQSPTGRGRVFDLAAATASVAYAVVDGVPYRSTDAGATWRRASAGIHLTDFVSVTSVAAAADPNVVYACVLNSGLYRSLDGAKTWHRRSGVCSEVGGGKLLVDPDAPEVIYDPLGGFSISRDGGATWQVPEGSYGGWPRAALMLPTRPRTFLVATDDDELLRSRDGGATWASVGDSLPHGRFSALALDGAAAGTVYAASGAGFAASVDGGATWRVVAERYDIRCLAALPDAPGALVACTAGGDVVRTSDGGRTWSLLVAGLTATAPTALAVDPRSSRTAFLATWNTSIRVTRDGGESWTPANPASLGPACALAIDPKTPDRVYVATDDVVFRSSDGGRSWAAPRTVPDGFALDALAIDPRTPTTLYAGYALGGVYKSVDGARSWRESSIGIDGEIVALVVDPARPATVYAAGARTANDSPSGAAGTFGSHDAGRTWTRIDRGLPGAPTPDVWGLAVDSRSGTVYAATGRGVYRRARTGTSWTAAGRGWPRGGATQITIHPRTGRLWAGTARGLYTLASPRGRWQIATRALAGSNIAALGLAPDGSRLYVASHRLLYVLDGAS
jgi:photosystem II stability/assembly factor-like uncharacterized protein